MEDIIVTGATGFIGRRLIRELVNAYGKDRILCLIRDKTDDLELSGRKILTELDVKTKYIDLVTGSGLEDMPDHPTIIFHLAASTESGDKDHRCNDLGLKNLLNAFPNLNGDTQFLFTSTTAIFSGRKDLDKPITKKTFPSPSNEYGRTKLTAEKTLKEFSEKTGMRTTVFRLSTVWGEGTRKNGLFDKMNKLILAKSFIPRLNWKGKTGLINVDDVVSIIILNSKFITRKNFNTCILSHESLTLTEISEVIHKRNNIKYKQIKFPDSLWKITGAIIKRTGTLEKFIPDGLYNIFWRLNLIVNDSLYCKPDEFLEEFENFNVKFKNFREDYKY